jgi:hypothetical protein
MIYTYFHIRYTVFLRDINVRNHTHNLFLFIHQIFKLHTFIYIYIFIDQLVQFDIAYRSMMYVYE